MQRVFNLEPTRGPVVEPLFYDIERESLADRFSQIMGRAELELSDWGSLRLPDDFRRPELDIGWHEVNVLLAGRGAIRFGGKPVAMAPGHGYFFPAGTANGTRGNRGVRKAFCHFRLSTRGVDLLRGGKHWAVPVESHEALRVERVFSGKNVFAVKAVLFELLSRSLATVEGLANPRLALREKYAVFFEAMDRGEPVSVLAAQAGKSRQAFSSSFKKVFGLTPKRYLLRNQVDRISRELSKEGKTLSEIAEDLGFKDPFYLSRFYKKQTGLSPSDFRQGLSLRV